MDSWFGKMRGKNVVDKVDEELDSDEERKRKEDQMKDTLRKLNTDEVLNDDDIARVTELARRPPKDLNLDASKAEPSTVDDAKTTVLQKSIKEERDEAAAAANDAPVASVVRIIEDDEHYETQFWD